MLYILEFWRSCCSLFLYPTLWFGRNKSSSGPLSSKLQGSKTGHSSLVLKILSQAVSYRKINTRLPRSLFIKSNIPDVICISDPNCSCLKISSVHLHQIMSRCRVNSFLWTLFGFMRDLTTEDLKRCLSWEFPKAWLLSRTGWSCWFQGRFHHACKKFCLRLTHTRASC